MGGRVVFDKCLLPPYTPRKALDKKSFPCHDACLYLFGWKMISSCSTSNSSFPPTIVQKEKASVEQKQESFQMAPIIPVTAGMIHEIRKKHLLCYYNQLKLQ